MSIINYTFPAHLLLADMQREAAEQMFKGDIAVPSQLVITQLAPYYKADLISSKADQHQYCLLRC